MVMNPILPWWVLLLTFAPSCVFVIWRLVMSWRTPQRGAWLRRVGLVFVVLLMALRPSVVGGSASSSMANIDVLFVVDTTSSMAAEDYNGTDMRLDGVRQDVKDIANAMPGARYGIITFSSHAAKELPLTSDATALHSLVSILEQEETVHSRGSSIDAPLSTLQDELTRLRENTPERQLVVYYISDGEQTNGEEIESFASLAPYIDGGAVLGYGTEDGGRMKLRSSSPGYSPVNPYITDYTDRGMVDGISRIDQSNLQTIARQMNVPYVWRQEPGGIDNFIKDIELSSLSDEYRDVSTYRDTYWIIAVLFVGLMLWEVWSMRSVLYDLRRTGGDA